MHTGVAPSQIRHDRCWSISSVVSKTPAPYYNDQAITLSIHDSGLIDGGS